VPRLPHPCAFCAQEPALSEVEGVGFHARPQINCHPERSEGSAVRRWQSHAGFRESKEPINAKIQRVWSESKREKLRRPHRNPVKRGLVDRPEDWPWSSFRHHLTGEDGVVEIESHRTATGLYGLSTAEIYRQSLQGKTKA